MRYEIIFSPEAADDFKKLSARERGMIIDAIEHHLRKEPGKVKQESHKTIERNGAPTIPAQSRRNPCL
jgi:mRNA-degrading endonuclease RelE of RelBE toxin-antitoxin system